MVRHRHSSKKQLAFGAILLAYYIAAFLDCCSTKKCTRVETEQLRMSLIHFCRYGFQMSLFATNTVSHFQFGFNLRIALSATTLYGRYGRRLCVLISSLQVPLCWDYLTSVSTLIRKSHFSYTWAGHHLLDLAVHISPKQNCVDERKTVFTFVTRYVTTLDREHFSCHPNQLHANLRMVGAFS